VIPDRTAAHVQAGRLQGLRAHHPDRDAVAVVVVVDHEGAADAGAAGPLRDPARERPVVRHQADEGRPAEAGVGRRRRHRQEGGRAQDRRAPHDLGRVEVAQVRDRGRVLGGAAGVGGGAPVAVGARGVERDELDVRMACTIDRQLGATQDVPAGPAGRAAQRQAGIDP